MLSPRQSRVILLPEDRRLIDMLGWSEDQYRYFVRQASTHNSIRPGEPTAFLIIPFLIKLVIGLALSYLASRLARRQANNPAQLNTNNVDGQNIVSGGRFAPRTGFGSTQNVVEMGSVIPVVFAKREKIGDVWYGGVRVNTNLLWSQLLSIGTGQIFRGVFMVGEGPIGALDPRQFAIGGNLLGTYDLDPTDNTSGRCSIYFRSGGGLLRSTDHIAGRLPANDEGNAENTGGAWVYDIRGINQAYSKDFCYVSKPNNQTAFGLYAGMGNNLCYRVNPVIRSTSNPQLKPFGNSGASYVTCNWDSQGKAERFKQNALFSSRSGMWSRNGIPTFDGQIVSLVVNDTVQYHLSSTSDYDTVFAWLLPPVGIAKCVDVAQAIAGRQRQWDDSIVVGELYKFGQALLVCISRTPDDAVFISEAENEPKGGGQQITASFRVIKGGLAQFTDAAAIGRSGLTPGLPKNGTQTSHLFRCAVASFVIDRPSQAIEIGYRSNLGIRYNGLCNFRDSYSYFWSDLVSCDLYQGIVVGAGQTFNTSNLTSGTVSLPEKRYAFFRVMYRLAGTDVDYTEINVNFCFASQTQQANYNYLRLQFPSAQRWEIMHVPLSGWEIRQQLSPGPLILLDARTSGPAKTGSDGAIVFNYSGTVIANNAATFAMAPTIPRLGDLGLGGQDGTSYADAFGALAEMFVYEEIQSSASQPEHEIAYVNLIATNPEDPTYANMATVGLNLRSGPGFSELNQFSVYVNCGYGATHLFPEAYAIILTNSVFGVGDILSPAQINFDSFRYAAYWNNLRKYFFDIGISDPVNVRSKGAEWAKLFLLDLSTKNGQFYLAPVAEFGKQYSPIALFTSGNANSVEVTERDSQERQPIRVTVKWREERQSSDSEGRGLFPVIREVTVREAGTPEGAPLVQVDMSEFCTSEIHAVDAAKMRCREQRLITHDIKLNVLPDRAAVEPGAIVKVGLELMAYEQPNNGVILADGTATTTAGTVLNNGTYDVVLWDGTTTDLQEIALLVEDGKVVGYSNAVFCIADAVQATQIFKVQVVDYDDDGNLDIVASYFPLEDDGTSSLLVDWDDPGSWVIEGLVGELPPDVPLAPLFTSVSISGPSSAVKDNTYTYIAEINGPSDGAYTYSWTGTNATALSPTSASTSVIFPSAGTGVLNLTVIRTVGGVSRSASKTITVTLESSNSVTIEGPNSRVGPGVDTFTAEIALPFTTASYEWTLIGEGTLSSITSSSTNLTVDGTDGGRVLSLSAVVDGVNYTALKVFSVFADDPLSINGPAIAAVGTYPYSGVLGESVPPGAWEFEWAIYKTSAGEMPVSTIGVNALAPSVYSGAGIIQPPPTLVGVNPLAPEVTGLPYDPLSLSPVAWWDSSDSSTITLDTGKIAQWDDKSGNGWDLIQANASQRPSYVTAGFNGLNVARWPNVNNDDFLATAPGGTFTFREFYVVAKYDSVNFSNYQGLFSYASNSGNGWFGGTAGGTGLYFPSNLAIYINGENATNRSSDMWPELGSGCLMRCLAPSDYTTNSGVSVGMDRLYDFLDRGWLGDICELIVLPTILSAGDRTDLESYLVDKWGI